MTMVTQTFKYQDTLLDFLGDLLFMGATQFQVTFDDRHGEFAVSYPAGTMPDDDEVGE